MRFFAVISLFLAGFIGIADAAAPQQRRGQATASAQNSAAPATTSARAAVSARAGVRNAPAAPTTARAAVGTRNTVSRNQTGGGTAAAPVAARAATVSARAGKTQKVINAGTTVAAAAQNTVVSDACRQKYEGCMDSFCMLDNISGGRCLCSDRYKELDTANAEIAKLDSQAYQLGTTGLERIEMGDAAETVIKKAQEVSQSLLASEESDETKQKRKRLDTSSWLSELGDDDNDIFDIMESGGNGSIEDKEGAELFRATHSLCAASMSECNAELSMLQKLYSQRIRSDCAAYENSLEKKRKESQAKLVAAEQSLRDAALEAYQNSNKYNLGQCAVKFKECMITTGGCQDDFTGCVGIAAAENAKKQKGNTSQIQQYDIVGTATKISIAASSYDALEAKKPLCFETVTKNCTRVADQVWDTFIKDIAPTIKSAELLAEDNLRQSCMSNISDCIIKACKDNIDPNDPDGSYDLCLANPDSVQSLCKVQIEPCVAADDFIMTYVNQKLAAMRVDACTNQIKACLQSDNHCGQNYQNCVGMDVSMIQEMCTADELTSCMEGDKKKTVAELNNIISGLFFQIDTTMLEQCQKIANDKIIEVCGSIDSCAAFDNDDIIGTESLLKYTDKDDNYVIEGLVSFGNVQIKETQGNAFGEASNGNMNLGSYQIDIADYSSHLNDTDPAAVRVVSALQSTANKISQKIAIIVNDPKVQMCTQGRDIQKITGRTNAQQTARYPRLLDSAIIMIANAGLDRANKNYMKKYNELVAEAIESQNDSIRAATCAAFAQTGKIDDTPYANLFNNTNKNIGISGNDVYSTKYIIKGADLQSSMKIASSGKGEFIQTDTFGNMVGSISMNSTYSAANNTCTITTTTLMCKNADAVITTDTECNYAGMSLGGGGTGGCNTRKGTVGGGGGVGLTSSSGSIVTTQHYVGNTCEEFGSPETITQSIKM